MSSDPQQSRAAAPRALPAPAPATRLAVPEPLAAILDLLRRGDKFLVCSHSRPDGDAVGSMLALGMVIEQMGKRASLVTADPVPHQYRNPAGVDRIGTTMRVHGRFDAAILLECDSIARTRLRGLENFFLVNIDHHITGLDFAQLNWIDPEAVSVGEMVYRLAQAAGAAITPQMAQCLYTTVLTDTGGFCYGNVRESTFALARGLVEAGADPIAIARDVYYSAPVSKLLLLGAALRRFKREGRLAWLWVTHQDMVRTCATDEDSEGIVNVGLGMADVDAVIFLRELPDGQVRMSLRSKSGLNVAAIAARLGGGGHQNAAGCTLDGPLARALRKVLAELRPALAERSRKRSR